MGFELAGRERTSRLILGTGGFPSLELLRDAIEASGTELVTVALRRVDPQQRGSIMDVLAQAGVECSQGALDLDLAGDDVEGRAAVDAAERDHDGSSR